MKQLFPLLSFLFLLIPQYTAGIGVSPSAIMVGDVPQDYRREYPLTLLRAPQDGGSITFRTQVTGEAAPYVSVEERVTLEDAEFRTEIPVLVDTGKIAPGEHQAFVSFFPIVENESATAGNGQQVESGLTIPVRFVVAGDSMNVDTSSDVIFSSVERTEDGVTLVGQIENTGNVDWLAEYFLFTYGDEAVESGPYDTLIPVGEKKEMRWELPADLVQSGEQFALSGVSAGTTELLAESMTLDSIQELPAEAEKEDTNEFPLILAAVMATIFLAGFVFGVFILWRRKTDSAELDIS
jgi:hypothetical protein